MQVRRSAVYALVAAAAVVVALLAATPAGALDPPNPHDPCSTAGKDTCHTTGIGFYATYRYGIRWFGDYYGLPDGGRGFCIDLGYWYPSRSYAYTLEDSPVLKNSTGKEVQLVNRQKIAYATWAYGRTTNPDRQAAVMLFVHSLMGDARPGEVDPKAIGPKVDAIFQTVAADAVRFHGPYRVEGSVEGKPKAGETSTATVRLLSAAGTPMPGVTFALAPEGAAGVPHTVTAGSDGVAHFTFHPTATSTVSITATAQAVPATLPVVYRAASEPEATNAQRLIKPTSQDVQGVVSSPVSKGHITVSTAATPTQVVAGHLVHDQVTIGGATESWHATVSVLIHGPFASPAEVSCTGTAWQGTFEAQGPGTYVTPKAAVHLAGWYVFQLGVPGDAANVGVRTSCTDTAERFFVQAQPTISTLVSSDTVAPGTPIYDHVTVGSLAGTTVTGTVELFGPFQSRSAMDCSGAPVWAGAVTAKANGTYKTDTFTPTVAGYYTYRASIDSTESVIGVGSPCGDDTETTFVKPSPTVETKVSSQETRPGSQILDTVTVTGSGALQLTIDLQLFGPFDTRGAIGCDGTALWNGTITAKGDGTYQSDQVTLDRVGYYVFRESIPETPDSAGFTGKCGLVPETVLASAKPAVTTQVTNDVVRPGAALSDQIAVSGLGKTEAAIQVQLFGPFASKTAIDCTGEPYAQTVVTAQGDGTLRSPPMKVTQSGFYMFHETLVARPNVAEVETACADTAETSLAAPAIITGRGDHTHLISVRVDNPNAPTRVQIPSLGIDAPVKPTEIDVKQGVLAVEANIHETAWWVDGAAPGDSTGSIMIAGHVDSAKAGAGAFFALKSAKPGTIVQLTSADGKTRSYRVTSVRMMPKAQLPTDIWSQKGHNHLELVTCGGPFDAAAGHYRDNIVVTAVPA